MKVEFTVPGQPKGKSRPRFSRHGPNVVTYTPETTRQYEALVRGCWKQQSGECFEAGTPLMVIIHGYFQIPKSTSKKKRAEMLGSPHTKKCDCDNLAKSILDAVSGYAFHDDKEISNLQVEKTYSDEPRVHVTIEEA